MRVTLPAIVKKAEGLMRDIELAVARFPRSHRYTLGAELRQGIMAVARLSTKAWREQANRAALLEQVSDAIDDLKLRMQLGQQIHAFRSFSQFEFLARGVHELGLQCGGWKRANAKGQNEQARHAPAQRPQTLSSRAASNEARS